MWNEAGKNPITGGFREKFDNLKMILVEKKNHHNLFLQIDRGHL